MNYEHTGNYYTLGHLSLFTGLTDRTLRTYIAQGLLEGEKINGVWHFTEEQTDAFLIHPAVRPAIRSKNNAIVLDFLREERKSQERICVILDLPGSDHGALSKAICTAITQGDFHDLRFSFDGVDMSRVILSGPVDQVLSLVSLYKSTH